MNQTEQLQNELDQLKKKETEEVKKVRAKYTELRNKIKKKYKTNKPKRKTIPKKVRIMVWNKYIGKEKGVGGCYCCGEEIHSMQFHVGHIIAVANNGSDKIDNLRPICGCCNKSMGTENMDEFKKRYMKEKIKVVKIDTVKKDVGEILKTGNLDEFYYNYQPTKIGEFGMIVNDYEVHSDDYELRNKNQY